MSIAMQPEPDARYPDVAAMRAALEHALAFLNGPTRPAYLAWVRRRHGDLTLPVLNRKIPLDRVYTALRVDSTSFEERRRSLIAWPIAAGAVAGRAEADRLSVDELLDLVESLPRVRLRELLETTPSSGTSLTVGEAFAKHPVLVICGGPGSGKTTIVRWLAVAAAACLEDGERSFLVETRHVDPGSESPEPFDLGPPRLPIFIRADDYAAHRQRMGPAALPLFEFLIRPGGDRPKDRPTFGDDAGELRGSAIPEGDVESLVRSEIVDRRALIIIDGLDEIASPNVRRDVRDAVQEFARLHIDRRPEGNRLVLTSRIDGYKSNELEGPTVGLVTVEKMSRPAIARFVRSWFGAIVEDGAEADRLSAALTAEIFKEDRATLLDLAGIPLLAGILLAVFRRGRLPDTRVELFEAAVAEFLRVWDERDLRDGRPKANHRLEYVRVLESLARELHAGGGSGLIKEDTLVARLPGMICAERGWSDPGLDPSAQLLEDAKEMLREIREPVGLMVPRLEGFYDFIHQTFREYLAAKHLLRAKTVDGAFANLRPLFGSTRWRVPLLMALGRFSHTHPREWPDLVGLILDEDDGFSDLLPRGALLLVAALEQDVSRRSPGLIARIVRRLLLAYSQERGSGRYAKLRELIEAAVLRLRAFDESATKVALIDQIGRADSATAAAALLRELEWYDRDLGTALLLARPHDTPGAGWPIHAALREMASPPPPPLKPWRAEVVVTRGKPREAVDQAETTEAEEVARGRLEAHERRHADAVAAYDRALEEHGRAAAEFQSTGRTRPRVDLPRDLLPLRRALSRDPALRDRVVGDPDWSRLIVGLYVGVGEFRSSERMREYYQFATYLELPDMIRRMFLAPLRDRWGGDDPVYSIAVHLDTTGSLWQAGWQTRPSFHEDFLPQESPLTEGVVLPALLADDKGALISGLRRMAESEAAAERADATLGLVLLGYGDTPEVRRGSSRPETRDRLRRAAVALRDPVNRAFRATARGMSAIPWKSDDWSDTQHCLGLIAEDSGIAVNPIILYDSAPVHARPRLLAQFLMSRFLGGTDDAVSLAAGALDELVKRDVPRSEIGRAIALAPTVRHSNHSTRTFSWAIEQIPPRTFHPTDVPIFVMTAMRVLDPRIIRSGREALGKILFPASVPDRGPVPEFAALALRDTGNRAGAIAALRRFAPGLDDGRDLPALFLEYAEASRGRRGSSPSHLARAMLQFLPLFPDRRDRLMARALGEIRKIGDRHLRTQAFEKLLAERPSQGGDGPGAPRGGWFDRLVGRASLGDRPGLLKEALRSARAIRGRDDRSRALARLAFHATAPERARLLREALNHAARIRPIRDRLETLELLAPQLAGHPDLRRRAVEAAGASDGSRPAWARVAGPLREALPGLFRHVPDDAVCWATLAASAEIRDHLPASDLGGAESLWAEFAVDPSPETVSALLRRAEVEGLVMSRAAALVIDELRPEALDLARPLVPYLHAAEPETLPILADWLRRRDDPLRTQAAILLAERDGLTEDVLPHVLDALLSHDDLVRARACGVVHPAIVPDRETGPTRSVSALGIDVLSTMIHQALVDTFGVKKQPARAVRISWARHDLVHDSPAILAGLIEAIRRDPEIEHARSGVLPLKPNPSRPGRVAERLLSDVEALTPSAWAVLLDGFRRGPMPVRTAVLTSVIRVVYKSSSNPVPSRMKPDWWHEFVAVIGGLAAADRPLLDVMLHDVAGVIRAAFGAARGSGDPRARVEAARTTLCDESKENLSELLEAPPPDPPAAGTSDGIGASPVVGLEGMRALVQSDARAARLVKLAGCQIYADDDPKVYLRPSGAVPTLISECPEAIDVLRDWLEEELVWGRPEGPFAQVRSKLLVATAQAVAVKPQYFHSPEDAAEIRRLLVEAATHLPDRIARSAAIVLLGQMQLVTHEVVAALGSTLLDVDDVRDAAMMAAEAFRRCAPGVLDAPVGSPEKKDGLYHRSAVVAFGYATVLESLGRSDETDERDRQRIPSALADAIRHADTDRVVHLGYTGSRLHDAPRLNQLLYRVLLRVADVDPPVRTGVAPAS